MRTIRPSHPFRLVFTARQDFDAARLALYRALADWVAAKTTFEPVEACIARFDEEHRRFVATITARGLEDDVRREQPMSMLERGIETYLDVAGDWTPRSSTKAGTDATVGGAAPAVSRRAASR